MLLFAEGDQIGVMAIVMTVSSFISSAATWGVIQFTAWRKTKKEESKKDHDDTLGYWKDLVTRQEIDRKEAVEREDKCQQRLNELTLLSGRMEEWIRHYEFHMKNSNVKYRSWKDTLPPAELAEAIKAEGRP